MRVLLDTHTLLWFLTDDDRLSRYAHGVITDSASDVLVSTGSLWEIAIKASLGKLSLAAPFDQLFPAQLEAERIGVLPVELAHLAALASLPFHHRDPFDRLIISQALAEGVPVISRDTAFTSYACDVVWERPGGTAA